MSNYGLVGNALIRAGLLDAAGLARAVETQTRRSGTLAKTVADLGLADEAKVTRTIAAALHLEFVEGSLPTPDTQTAALLPPDFCEKRLVFPLDLKGNRLRIAVGDPLDYSVVQDVEFRTGKKVVPVLTTYTAIEKALGLAAASVAPPVISFDKIEAMDPVGEVEVNPDPEIDAFDPVAMAKDTNLPPIVRLVNRILSEAAAAGASDIHVEPQEGFLQVRHRVDGLLRESLNVPHYLQDQTISRFKIISGMDIAERRKPQDGRSRLRFEGKRIDLRVSTLPTQHGEKVVVRLLNSDRSIQSLEALGFAAENLRLMKSFLSRPQGMILVTGPTGSGKTSTLYTALKWVKSPSNNIITLEDPIELQLAGVNQMQVNIKAGVNFADGLRSILRQDPNIILVGEIRDGETANVALQAAQTGHLLLSTLHTNDAPATITRLLDLGIQPFTAASALVGIVAQRLVRRVCPRCAVEQEPSAEIVEKIGGPSRLPANAQWRAGKGCPDCAGSGLKGRLPIHEVLSVDDDVRALISSRASEQEIRTTARRAGMRTLLEDGLEKAALGLTTIEEVLRVVAIDAAVDSLAELRRSTDEPADRKDVAVSSTPTAPRAAATASASSTRPRVLIVEDSPTVVSVVKYFLELEGFDVLVAGDGRAGLELALAEHPDMIVSDVSMPAMNGVDMVRALRADPRSANVRILMLTSESSVESETEGLEAGADDYILKPVEPRRLAARVKALMSRSRGAA